MKIGYENEEHYFVLPKVDIIKLEVGRNFFIKGRKKEVLKYMNSEPFYFYPSPYSVIMEKKKYGLNKLKVVFKLDPKNYKIKMDDDELPPYSK